MIAMADYAERLAALDDMDVLDEAADVANGLSLVFDLGRVMGDVVPSEGTWAAIADTCLMAADLIGDMARRHAALLGAAREAGCRPEA